MAHPYYCADFALFAINKLRERGLKPFLSWIPSNYRLGIIRATIPLWKSRYGGSGIP